MTITTIIQFALLVAIFAAALGIVYLYGKESALKVHLRVLDTLQQEVNTGDHPDAWYSGAIWVFRQINDEWDRNDPIWRGTR
nr:MAG TPA: hypothetical protein [Caudoviricetes sp.]